MQVHHRDGEAGSKPRGDGTGVDESGGSAHAGAQGAAGPRGGGRGGPRAFPESHDPAPGRGDFCFLLPLPLLLLLFCVVAWFPEVISIQFLDVAHNPPPGRSGFSLLLLFLFCGMVSLVYFNTISWYNTILLQGEVMFLSCHCCRCFLCCGMVSCVDFREIS